MNVVGLYIFSVDKKLLQFHNPEYNYPIDQIIQSMNINGKNYAVFEHVTKAFHILIKSEKIFVMVTVLTYPKRVGLQCLEEMDVHFISGKKAINLKAFYNKYNQIEQIDVLSNVKAKVEDTKTVMHDNITKALENQVKLELIELQSEELMQNSGIFMQRSKQLKNKMWWKNMRMKIMVGTFALVVIGLIIGIAVGVSNGNNSNSN
jgi:hypothetical protein